LLEDGTFATLTKPLTVNVTVNVNDVTRDAVRAPFNKDCE